MIWQSVSNNKKEKKKKEKKKQVDIYVNDR